MKRAFFWLTVGVVLFSFQGGVAKPTKAQLDSLEALQPAAISTSDTISYDSLTKYSGAPLIDSSGYWIAVQFTNDRNTIFNLTAIFFKIDNSLINETDGCQLVVAHDANGRPGTTIATIPVSAPLPNNLRSTIVSPSIQILPDTNFWILLGPVPGGPNTDVLHQGWWGLHDSLPSRGRSFVSFDNKLTWNSLGAPPLSPGNWGIRAGGFFNPPSEVVINEVMFNPDRSSADPSRNHQWVELFNPEATQRTGGYQIKDGTTFKTFTLPDSTFKTGGYLVIHFANGNDSVQGNRMDIYDTLSSHRNFFNPRRDACLLKIPIGSDAICRDLVSWNLTGLALDSTPDFNLHNAETECRFDLFDIDDDRVHRAISANAIGPLLSAAVGTSIGRDAMSDTATDRNVTFVGGKDAAGPTPGRQNALPMVIDNSNIDSSAVSPANWTLMLYFAADNGEGADAQERWCYDLLNQIEREIPSTPVNVNVAVWFDSRSAFPKTDATKKGTVFRGVLRHDLTDTVRNLDTLGELNSGDPASLKDFVGWAKTKFNAGSYALALKGDGAGWQGLCGDATSGDRLEMGDLKSALQPRFNGDSLDLLIFDAPLMSQLEVATQVKNFAHRMVASPEMIGPADFDYPRLVEDFKGGLDTSALVGTLKTILKDRTANDPFAVWTIINLDNLETLTSSVDGLAINMERGVADPCVSGNRNDNFQLQAVRAALINHDVDHYGTQAQGMADFIDLRRFAENISHRSDCGGGYLTGAASLNISLRRNGPVIEGLEGGGLSGYHASLSTAGLGGGLSIYFPSSRQRVPPPSGKVFDQFKDSSDHPFDAPGFTTEGGVQQDTFIYASDMSACYPHPDDTCGHYPPPNYPHPPLPDFYFRDSTHWDEFLIRYYKPVADAGGTINKKLNEVVPLNASGTSDPDDNLLFYFWDVSPNDSKPACADSMDDLDRDCIDVGTDEADYASTNQIVNFPGFFTPGDRTVWLHVWDERDRSLGLPWYARAYNTSKRSVTVQIQWRGVQFVPEDQTVAPVYSAAFGRIHPTIAVEPHNDLDDPDTREAISTDKFTAIAGKPHIVWSTGLIPPNKTFPLACRQAIDNALNFDSMGVWICGPKVGVDGDVGVIPYFTSKGITISSGTASTTSLVPDGDTLQFLYGLGSLELNGTQQLETLSVSGSAFPILRTNTGQLVAAARVVDSGTRALVYCAFGLEQLQFSDDIDSLMQRVLSWLSFPISRTTIPEDTCTLLVRKKGDFNCDDQVTPADLVSGLNCVYLGMGSCDTSFADVTCDGQLLPSDVVRLLNMVFLGGPACPSGSGSSEIMAPRRKNDGVWRQ